MSYRIADKREKSAAWAGGLFDKPPKKMGTALGTPVCTYPGWTWWVPVLWDDEKEPSWIKLEDAQVLGEKVP